MLGARRVAQLSQGLGLNLPNAFSRESKSSADVVESSGVAICHPEPEFYNHLLARRQAAKHRSNQLLEFGLLYRNVRICVRSIRHRLEEALE